MWNSALSKACLVLSVLILFIGFASPLALADYSTVEIDGRTWTTNDNFEPIGSPDAVHGGELRTNIPNFLPTLRRDGPNSNLATITENVALKIMGLFGNVSPMADRNPFWEPLV